MIFDPLKAGSPHSDAREILASTGLESSDAYGAKDLLPNTIVGIV